jgi:hypothetical protein
MIDRHVAETQSRLSYVFVIGFFGLKLMEGLKWITPVSADLNELLMLVATFWFLRSRSQEKPNA